MDSNETISLIYNTFKNNKNNKNHFCEWRWINPHNLAKLNELPFEKLDNFMIKYSCHGDTITTSCNPLELETLTLDSFEQFSKAILNNDMILFKELRKRKEQFLSYRDCQQMQLQLLKHVSKN